MVLHNKESNIEYPQPEYGMFAVVEFAGKQHKVMKDETVMVEKIEYDVGTKLVLD